MSNLTYLALLLSTVSLADTSVYAKYGVGVFNSGKYSYAETKEAFVGVQYVDGFFVQQLEFGGWVDGRSGDGRKSSTYTSYNLGIQVFPAPLLIQTTIGAGVITNPDSYLGGYFNFNEENYIGFKDSKGTSWMVGYRHVSSGGLSTPNVGRDFLMFRVSFPLGR